MSTSNNTLEASERRLRNIMDGLGPDMFVGLLSTEGIVLEANRQALVAAGLKPEDVLGKPVEETYWFSYSPETQQQMRTAVARAASGETSRFDVQIRAAESQFISLDFSLQPFRDASGEVVLLVPSAIDITERKRAEAALHESEAKLAEIFNRVSDAFVALDKDWRYTYVNNQAAALFGRLPGQLLGKHIWTEFPEGLGQPFHLAYEKAMAEQLPVFFEDYYPPYDRWFENRIYPSPDGLTIYFHDITERKRAGEALRESEERLRLALDAAHMGTFDWDIPNDLITWSRWHEELWGIKPGKSGNTFEVFAQRVHPQDLPGINAEITRCLTARELFAHEWRVVWPDASMHWISCRGEFTFSPDGQPLHMRGVAVEITKRKQAELLLSGEKIVMEMIVEGAPLSEILEAITRSVEAVCSDTLCSILLLDDQGVHLQHGAAPSLPADYSRAVHGEKIGPQAGSCGTAAYRNQTVIVSDIATDPLWDDYRALAISHGLRACWSTPIRAADGQVMGSFALYYREPRTPGPADFELIARMTPLSAIAIERRRAEQTLRESEERYHAYVDQAADALFVHDFSGRFVDVNPKACASLGYSREELLAMSVFDVETTFDLPRAQAAWRQIFPGQHFTLPGRQRRKDGFLFPVEARFGCFDLKGERRFMVLVRDVTEREQAEAIMLADSRQLQALSKRVLEVQEAERRHVARELHDELGQILTAIKINLQARNRLAGQSPVEIDSANIGMVDQAIDQVRRLALTLRPSMLDDMGLMAALRWAAEQTLQRAGLAVQWQGDLGSQRLAPGIETACYRIAQEAFTNIVRHAQAQSVMIALQHEGERLLLTVHDDGRGFDVDEMRSRAIAGGSIGVLGMQERAALVGGKMKIESAPGQGTIIQADFPWHMRDEEDA